MKKTIVAFHIGRGGRFNNAGYLRFEGVMPISEIVSRNDCHYFYTDRDKKGRFCSPHLIDSSGEFALPMVDYNSGVGTLNIDNDYNTYYTKYAGDCSEEECILILKEAQKFNGVFISQYPIFEIMPDVSTFILLKAAELGKLVEVYEYYHKGEEWIKQNILEDEK